MAVSKKLSNITIKIDDFLQIENMNIDSINLFVGKNGAGKTIVLKMNWLFAMLNNIILASMEIRGIDTVFVSNSFEYLFNNTFPENNWTGILEYQLTTGESAQIRLKDGKATSIVYFNYNDASEPLQTIFMSKSTRTFEELDRMLDLRKRLLDQAGEKGLFKERPNITYEMSKSYKYHDVQLLEVYLYLCNNYTYDSDMVKLLSDNYDIKNIHRLYIDEDSNKFKIEFKDDNGNITIKSASLLSAGEQAVLNMFTATSIIK